MPDPGSIAHIADKLAGGVVSYIVRQGANAALKRPKAWWEDRKRREALRQVANRALARFADKHPDLSASFFDETFIETRAGEEIGKLLTLDENPDAEALATAYAAYFKREVPGLPAACEDFLEFLRAELVADAELKEIVSDRLIRSTAAGVDKLSEQFAALAEQVARDKGVPAAPLRAVLVKLGEAHVPDHEIPQRLDAAADELIALRAQLLRLTNERPELAAIRKRALALIDRGDFDQARAVLNRGRETARALREEASRSEAELLADEARIDHLQLAYRAAAAKFAEAAVLVASFDRSAQWGFLMNQASELYDHGRKFGDNEALAEAIAAYGRALALVPRATSSLDWAMTQNNLGNALATLGEREASTARLKEAVAAYRAALSERTRERVPLQWAMTQNDLGNALQTLGVREAGTARLEEAVAAYRAALSERTRERLPLDWATTQNNLGAALQTLGKREASTARLEEAVAAYRTALSEWTRERVPLQWAAAQNNLGNALQTLGEREADTARLGEAVAAYREALSEWIRERVPLNWATTQNNLGTALQTLGAREVGTARLEQAVAAYRAALSERIRERVPLQWATTQNNLGTALLTLGEREAGTARLEEAVTAFRAALSEWTREHMPLQWAMTQNNLGNALLTLGEREAGTARLEEAVAAYRDALSERTRERVPLDWAMSTGNQGVALMALAERLGDAGMAETAVSQIERALATMRDGNHAPFAAYYAAQLPKARALVDRLSKRGGPT
ncbi:MAG TPA: tetratricopeptide repeat protein [Stellaceae bacterium]|nr:tetratricopeptide repeat protein [Stellaceae bacterium]